VHIRRTTTADLPSVMAIYASAREFMRESGNAGQWGDEHPPRAMIEDDIRRGESYVCEKDGEVLAVFMISPGPDPTYEKIDGAWQNDAPYSVVHRIARHSLAGRGAKGVGAFCLNWCIKNFGNLRIDTHKDNAPMLKLLGQLGFIYCGIIWLENGDERLAFQKAIHSL